jgi:type IV secretion system pilin
MKLIKPIFAQITNPIMKGSGEKLANPVAFFNKFIQGVFSMFMLIGFLYFVAYFILASYHLISSEGDKGKFQIAKDQFTHAFMGLIILFSVFAILKLIGIIFSIEGLDELKLVWPSLV